MDDWILQYPKIELHCHLDGSIPPDTIRRLTENPSLPLESMTVEPECRNLAEYLKRFDLPLSVMQTEEGLTAVAEDFLESLKADGVRYVEVRFAPMLCVNQGLTCRQVMEAVLKGLERGKQKTGIFYNVIVCAMRNHSYEENFHVLLTALEFYKAGVCAFDLAGDESSYPTGQYQELFRKAKDYRMPYTIHAGECGSVGDIRAAFEFGARRIGHGIALIQDKDLMKQLEKKGVGLEVCPTSNFQTQAVTKGTEYPLKALYEAGVKVTINTDNRTVSGTDLTKELAFALALLGSGREPQLVWQQAAVEKLEKNAIDIAFADDSVKDMLWKLL